MIVTVEGILWKNLHSSFRLCLLLLWEVCGNCIHSVTLSLSLSLCLSLSHLVSHPFPALWNLTLMTHVLFPQPAMLTWGFGLWIPVLLLYKAHSSSTAPKRLKIQYEKCILLKGKSWLKRRLNLAVTLVNSYRKSTRCWFNEEGWRSLILTYL